MTWNGKPDRGALQDIETSENRPHEWDVVDAVSAAFDDTGQERVAFVLRQPSGLDEHLHEYDSREADSDHEPELEIQAELQRGDDLHSSVVVDEYSSRRWGGVREKIEAQQSTDQGVPIFGLTYDPSRDNMWATVGGFDGNPDGLVARYDSEGQFITLLEFSVQEGDEFGPVAYIEALDELIIVENDWSRVRRFSIDEANGELVQEQSANLSVEREDIDGALDNFWMGGEPDKDQDSQFIRERDADGAGFPVESSFELDDVNQAAALGSLEDEDELVLIRRESAQPGIGGEVLIVDQSNGSEVASFRFAQKTLVSAAVWGSDKSGELWTVHPKENAISSFWIRVTNEISSSVEMGRQFGSNTLDSTIEPANLGRADDIDSDVTPQLSRSADLDTSVQPANLEREADLDCQVQPNVGGEAEISSQAQPANIPETSGIDSDVEARTEAEADLDATTTPRVDRTQDLSSTAEPLFSADLDSTMIVGGLEDLDATATPRVSRRDHIEAQVQPSRIPRDETLTSIAEVTAVPIEEPHLGRAEGRVAPTVVVDESDMADVSGEVGTAITLDPDGEARDLRRVVHLLDGQERYPRARADPATQLHRGDAVLYAQIGDEIVPDDVVEWQDKRWKVVGLLGWETVGDSRLYQEVGLRRLATVHEARATGTVS